MSGASESKGEAKVCGYWYALVHWYSSSVCRQRELSQKSERKKRMMLISRSRTTSGFLLSRQSTLLYCTRLLALLLCR